GFRARAVRRAHCPIRRQGARARARGEGLRLGRCRDGGSEGLSMSAVAERHEALVAQFETFRRDPAFGAEALRAIREQSFQRFLERGFPTTRQEDWKFTSVAPIAETAFVRAGNPQLQRAVIEPFLFAGVGAVIALVNGRLSKTLSALDALPAGVTIR